MSKSINLKQHDVHAFLNKRKTQHRIPIKPQPYIDDLMHIWQDGINYGKTLAGLPAYRNFIECKSKHQPGDILYVKETWMDAPHKFNVNGVILPDYKYKASASEQFINEWLGHWRPSIHMPKAAARIWLRAKDVRVERLQEISQDDAVAEGIQKLLQSAMQLIQNGDLYRDYSRKPELFNDGLSAIKSYASLIDSIHGPGTWEANPWVWVYDLEQIEKPM